MTEKSSGKNSIDGTQPPSKKNKKQTIHTIWRGNNIRVPAQSQNKTCILHVLRMLYIMQSCLPTTIYVQNLSFFVSKILTSHNFFSIWPIYMIFMGEIDKVCNFLTPPQKKRVKKGKI